MTKQCFKCRKHKPLDEFYAHPQTADGHLGKCKTCTKRDVNARYSDPSARKRIAAYEKKRFQSPERKAKILLYQRRRRAKSKGKYRANRAVTRALRGGIIVRKPCEVCNDPKSQGHHDDYRKVLSVRWLCFKHHREAHGQTVS